MAKNKSDNTDNPRADFDEQDVRDAHYYEDGVDDEGNPVESSEKEE